jgi:hypothetical protein
LKKDEIYLKYILFKYTILLYTIKMSAFKKNTKGGKDYKKKKKRRNEFVDPIEDQKYGVIEHNHGAHWIVLCEDNIRRQAKVKSNIARLNKDDFVVISLRSGETNDKNCDVIGTTRPPKNIIDTFKKFNPNIKNINETEYFDDSDDDIRVDNKKSQKNVSGYGDDINYPGRSDEEGDEDEGKENENEDKNNKEKTVRVEEKIKSQSSNTKISKLLDKFTLDSDEEELDDL